MVSTGFHARPLAYWGMLHSGPTGQCGLPNLHHGKHIENFVAGGQNCPCQPFVKLLARSSPFSFTLLKSWPFNHVGSRTQPATSGTLEGCGWARAIRRPTFYLLSDARRMCGLSCSWSPGYVLRDVTAKASQLKRSAEEFLRLLPATSAEKFSAQGQALCCKPCFEHLCCISARHVPARALPAKSCLVCDKPGGCAGSSARGMFPVAAAKVPNEQL